MRRLRLTLVHDFNWTGPELSEDGVNELIASFVEQPTEFLGLDRMPEDENLILSLEDVTDEEQT